MKKVFVVLFELFLINCFFCFSQVSVDKASRKTAERCLKLSESYLLNGNIEEALSQAEMGLSYDDSVSDLYYIKAIALKKNGASVRDVLELAKIANDKNTWVGYNEKGNRILYADLLSDTGSWLESLEVLDRAPIVFSADAEAIRVKNYYRIGTDEYLSKAREKINTARRMFRGDIRFFSLFFSFEISRCIKYGVDYQIEPEVLKIADVLNAELKSYKDLVNDELECLSIFFMEGEEQVRAIKAFDANGGSDLLYSIIALKSGVLTESESFDLFFEFADKAVPVELLKYFATMITEDELRQKLYDYLNAYSGTLYADLDRDMQTELKIVYERGRPQYIHYDYDNDGYEDLYGTFDFGELLSICVKPLGLEIYYSPYPWVGRAVLTQKDSAQNENVLFFEFSKNAAQISPLNFKTPPELQIENTENRFYVPIVKSSWENESNLEFLRATSFIKGASSEREGATVTYSVLDGDVVSAVYSVNDVSYATAEFHNSIPSERLVDYDSDGLFETTEIFVLLDDENKDGFSEIDKENIRKLFPLFDYSEFIYLSSIFIDHDNDNTPDYQELYLGNDGKAVTFFFANGKSESYIRYPHKDNSPIIEASIFVTGLDNDIVTVVTSDGIPSEVEFNGTSYEIFPGVSNNFYWIGKKYETSEEITILEKTSKLDQGKVILVEAKGKSFKCIKVGLQIFAKSDEVSEVANDDLAASDVKDEDIKFSLKMDETEASD